MAKFTDLSNELIIAIGSHIRKPAHILQLVLLNRRTHDLIVPLLYEHIVFHSKDYPGQGPFLHGNQGPGWNISRLAVTLSGNSALRSVTRTFQIDLDSKIHEIDFSVLLSLMTSLKRFRLLRASLLFSRLVLCTPLSVLDCARETLESLDISKSGSCRFTGPGDIPDLKNFTALKDLCIQSRCCIGDFRTRPRVATLRGFFPPRLQSLRMVCRDYSAPRAEPSRRYLRQGEALARLLVDLMEETRTTPRALRSVVLQLSSNTRVQTRAAKRVQKMANRLGLCSEQLNEQRIEMEASVWVVELIG